MQKEHSGFIVGESLSGKRLDVALSELLDSTRSQWKKRIEAKQVLVEGEPTTAKYILKANDSVTILPQTKSKIEVPIPIVFENEEIIVIDKPSGILVHAKDGMDDEETLVDYFSDRINKGTERGGIVHRLDRETSGVMVMAKNNKAFKSLKQQFKDRTVVKKYFALVSGVLSQKSAVIKYPIERNPKKPATFRVGENGKYAETEYSLLETNGKISLIECILRTGRTHQLRVHFAHLGHPILGDKFYNGVTAERLMLHSHYLEVETNGERQSFKSEIPDEFSNLVDVK